MPLRRRLHSLLEGEGPAARRMAVALTGLILASAIIIAIETLPNLPTPLAAGLAWLEVALVVLFTVEYLARLFSAPDPLRYALSVWGLVDLIAILPALLLLAPDWAALRTLRLLRLARLLKLFRADRALARLGRALTSIRGELAVFGFLAVVVIYLAAVGIYHFEADAQPEHFGSIPASLWWAIATLTTVGYGDVYPITTGGQIFTALVLLVGLGVVAVPAGLVTAALLSDGSGHNKTPTGDHE